MIVAFCGHKNVSERYSYCILEIERILWDICEFENKLEFLCGGYGEFNGYCVDVLIKLRNNPDFPKFKMNYVLPYPHVKNLPLMDGFYDEIIYPDLDDVYYKNKIIQRNKWIVENCDVLVAYVKNKNGGAARMLNYALALHKKVVFVEI